MKGKPMRTDIDVFNDPFRAMRRLEREMNRLFENFYSTPFRGEEVLAPVNAMTPPCDIQETESHFLVSADMPGVAKEDINVEVRGNQLFISGERKKEHKEESKERYFEEKQYGCYERMFTLPSHVDAAKLEANYKDGVLRIALPKGEGAKSQKVQIGEAKTGWWEKLLGKAEKKEQSTKSAA